MAGLLLFVAAAYIVELIFSQPNLAQLGKGMVIPSLPTSEAVFLAAGVLGATIMPHVIYCTLRSLSIYMAVRVNNVIPPPNGMWLSP
ncbi:manganese transport protein [Escherichia coli]|uniref:Manganese transport protein n=1 Tax=Escherichia coli TaxID=562 RepID=A0A377D3S8_ECOLX|nr:manganese transport protein [Escherichia coli]